MIEYDDLNELGLYPSKVRCEKVDGCPTAHPVM
jgi:hypothetical protein